MAYTTFAAIDVGSNDVSMKIFQVTMKKGFKEIDYVSSMIELGSDTYRRGSICNEVVDGLCNILVNFKKKMKEYDVVDYRAYATSAIREAENSRMVLDRIKLSTDLDVEILSNSEHRFLMYKGLAAKYAEYKQIIDKNTALVDIGAGSVQISIFDKQQLCLTQNIPIGTVRVRDYLSIMQFKTVKLEKVIEEYVNNEITTFRNLYLKDSAIKHVIAVGDEISVLIKAVPELEIKDSITMKQFEYIYKKIVDVNPHELAMEYGIQFERATLMVPSAVIYLSFLQQSKAERVWTPNIVLCDGIVADYMEKERKLFIDRSFNIDIIASAQSIAKRYNCSKIHIQNVTTIALGIFDCLKKVYGLGPTERMQLELAAILHDCGKFINMNDGANNSYNIIMSTEIMGLSHVEREEIANIVKYNTLYLSSYAKVKSHFGECDYVKVAKLAAVLRIANVMDRSHKQKIEKFTVVMKDKQLVITADTMSDLTLETGLFEEKANFFEKVYGIRPILKQKRRV